MTCVLASCSKKDGRDHEHTYGEWVYLDNPACTRAKYCECGYRHIVSIPIDEHTFGADGICVICEAAVEPTKRAEHITLLNELFGELKEYDAMYNRQYNMYMTAWEFLKGDLSSYTSYDSLLEVFSEALGIDKDAFSAEITKIAKGTGQAVSPKAKLRTLKEIKSVIKAINEVLIKEGTHSNSVDIDDITDIIYAKYGNDNYDDKYKDKYKNPPEDLNDPEYLAYLEIIAEINTNNRIIVLMNNNLKTKLLSHTDLLAEYQKAMKAFSKDSFEATDADFTKLQATVSKIAENLTTTERTYEGMLEQYA